MIEEGEGTAKRMAQVSTELQVLSAEHLEMSHQILTADFRRLTQIGGQQSA